MDPIVTTMAELIDASIAADRPAPLGASALSRLAFWPRRLFPGRGAAANIYPPEMAHWCASALTRLEADGGSTGFDRYAR